MGELKSGLQKRQKYINMKNRWCEIPSVLGKHLMMNGAFIFCILLAGNIMENRNPGEGFLKLTMLCTFVLGCRLLYLLLICYWKLYTVEDGVAAEVQQLKKGRQYYRVEMIYLGRREWVEIPIWNEVQKGNWYRCYWRNGKLLGIEQLR